MRSQAEPGNEGLEGARQSLWICVPRQSRGTRERGIGRSEAEPLDMRSQAEPGNEGYLKTQDLITSQNLFQC
jgi:hypothetical protein